MKQYFMAFAAMLLLGVFAYQFFGNDIDSSTYLGLTAGIPVGPVIIPDGGTYRRPVTVTIESSGSGTGIRYTKNGEMPSCNSGIVYDEPFTITRTTSIRAIDCGMGGQSMETQADFVFKGSSKGGGSASDPTDVPYGPTCATDPLVCPPEAPTAPHIADVPDQPAYGNVIADGNSPFYRDLSIGSAGQDVSALQEVIIMHASGPHALSLGRIGQTGYFGLLTYRALSEFQHAFNIIPAGGYFGPTTRGKINALMGWMPTVHY